MTRMMDLKLLFPQNDVARMVELVPRGFLSRDWNDTKAMLQESSEVLREGLKGADVDAMFDDDPSLLFEDPGQPSVRAQENGGALGHRREYPEE